MSPVEYVPTMVARTVDGEDRALMEQTVEDDSRVHVVNGEFVPAVEYDVSGDEERG